MATPPSTPHEALVGGEPQRVKSIADPISTLASSNDSNRRRLCQAVARISYQSLFEGSGPASCSVVLPAAIIVEGAPAHTSRPIASERFSPRAPAPAAPPLPAQYAMHRSRPDGSAHVSRRSIFPSTCRPRRSACDNPNRRRVRVDDEMVPDPLVDPIALVTDGGEASRIDRSKRRPPHAQDRRRRANADLAQGIRLVGTEPQQLYVGGRWSWRRGASGSIALMTASASCSIIVADGDSSPSTTRHHRAGRRHTVPRRLKYPPVAPRFARIQLAVGSSSSSGCPS